MSEVNSPSTLTEARLNALAGLDEWQKLLTHFDLDPDSFAFIPVFVPDESWASLCEKVLTDYLQAIERKKLLTISLKTPDELRNLAVTFFNLEPDKAIGGVWITAPIPFRKDELEEWQQAWREGMARLNQYRNPFRRKFEVPVLLVGAEWTKEITRNMAPDLWSVITISIRIEPPAINIGETQQMETPPASSEFESWRSIDPYFALKEAERLRGKKGQEFGLARILYRATKGFLARAKYSDALQSAHQASEIIQHLLSISNETKNSNIIINYANTLNAKGYALIRLGKLRESIAEFNKAIEIREQLVNKEKREEFAEGLANAYQNKGIALNQLGELRESIAEFNKAIEIREQLVNKEKREEFAEGLASAYQNKGIALAKLHLLTKSIAEFNKAIEIYEQLVNKEKREKSAPHLSRAHMNKGVTLKRLGRLDESIAEYDKVIEIYERLVNYDKHEELTISLAMAYINKGNALENLSNLEDAAIFFDKGIEQWNNCLVRDEIEVLPNFVRGLRLSIRVLIKLKDWKRTASNIVKAFNIEKYLKDFELSEHFTELIATEQYRIIRLLSEVPADYREKIYKYAGKKSEMIRQLVENFENDS